MKSFITLILCAAVLVAAGPVQDANAQIEFTLGGGVTEPRGDFGDQFNTGYAFTTGLGWQIVPMFVVGADLSYSGNGAPDGVTESLGPGYDLTSNIFQYGVNGKLVMPYRDASVYFKGSFGSYRASATVSGPLGDASISVTDPGYGLGGGFVFGKASAFYADVTYHKVNFDGDGDTSFFMVTVGALLRFNLFEPELSDDVKDDLERLRD